MVAISYIFYKLLLIDFKVQINVFFGLYKRSYANKKSYGLGRMPDWGYYAISGTL
jgi:hypothetical protein